MRRITCAICALVVSGGAVAAIEPQGIAVGGASLIPTIRIQHQHDDNIFSSDIFEQSSTITNLTPRLEYFASRDDENYLSISYDGDWARYWQSRDDDYIDHTFTILGAYSGSDYLRISADASTAKLHDNRGEGASEGLGALVRGEPDEYDQDTVGVLFDFGRPDARLGASVGVRTLDIEYTTNTAVTQFRDRDDREFDGKLFFRVTGKTRAVLGYRDTDIEYDRRTLDDDTLDSDESTAYIGLEWEATGRTTGSLEVGRLDKDFDSPNVDEEDLTVWSIGLIWQPRSYSTVTFNSSRDAGETNGTGTFIEQTNHSASWIHDWSDRLHSTVSVVIGDDEYPGSTREDDRDDYTVGLDYDFRRWMNLGFRLQYSERDSNFDLFDYTRRRVYVTLDLSL